MVEPWIAHEDDLLKVVTWDLVIGVRWFDIPIIESLHRFRQLQGRHFRMMGDTKSIVVSYTDASGDLQFESGAREAVESIMGDCQSNLISMAQVIVGDGFGAASVRSVLSGIQLTVRPDYQVKLFGTLGETQPWVEDQLLGLGRPDLARSFASQFLARLSEPYR